MHKRKVLSFHSFFSFFDNLNICKEKFYGYIKDVRIQIGNGTKKGIWAENGSRKYIEFFEKADLSPDARKIIILPLTVWL